MATEVSICNHALALLGQQRVLTLDDDTREAGACKDTYAPTRDAMLEENAWTFARAQASLPAETTVPVFGYTLSFPLPPDCINVTWAGPDSATAFTSVAWERVGDRIYARPPASATTSIFIWYTRRVQDAQQFPPAFADVLATRVAAELAYAFTESAQRHQALWQVYERKLVVALGAEGQQGRSKRTYNQDLTRQRAGGRLSYFITGM